MKPHFPKIPESVKMSDTPVKKGLVRKSVPTVASKPSASDRMTLLYDRLGLDWSNCDLTFADGKKKGISQIRGKRLPGASGTIVYCDGKITVFDLDDMEKPSCISAYEKLSDSCNMIAKTLNGFHFVFKKHPKFPSTVNHTLAIDVRTDKDIILAEPSFYTHPDKGLVQYEWVEKPKDGEDIHELPEECADFILGLGLYGSPKPKKNEIVMPEAEEEDAPTPRSSYSNEALDINHLCGCLDADWLNNTSNWLKFLYAMKNIADNTEMLDVFLFHSARAKGYDTPAHRANNRKMWDSIEPKARIGLGSLKHWARTQNPRLYFEEAKNHYAERIKLNNSVSYCEMFQTAMAGDLLYSKANRCYFVYEPDRGLWKKCELPHHIHFLFITMCSEVIDKLIAELPRGDEDEMKAYTLQKKNLLAIMTKIDSRVSFLVSSILPALVEPEEDPANYFNQNADLLPLQNGVWCFSEKKLRPYEREHYFTFRIPINYNASADTSLMERAMNDWFRGDKATIDFHQYFIGYCLTGKIDRQQFLVSWGSKASNGKSTLYGKVMKYLLGNPNDLSLSYYHIINSDSISEAHTNTNNDELYNLNGKRFAFLSEPRKGAKSGIDDEVVKKLTGDEDFSAQAKYKGSIIFKLSTKFVMACNSIPTFNFDDAGIYRRIAIAEQNVEFKNPEAYEEESKERKAKGDVRVKDDTFIEALLADKEGMMLWALKGACAYVDDPTRSPPPSMATSKARAEEKNDKLGAWIRGNILNYKLVASDKRPEKWEKCRIAIKQIKDRWKGEGDKAEDFKFNKSGFNGLFCEKLEKMGYTVERGRPGKSEERIIGCDFIPDADEMDSDEEENDGQNTVIQPNFYGL